MIKEKYSLNWSFEAIVSSANAANEFIDMISNRLGMEFTPSEVEQLLTIGTDFILEKASKENKTRLQLFIEQSKGEARTLEEGLKTQEQIRDKRLGILLEEIQAGKKTQVEGELERLKIKNDYLEQEKDLVLSFAESELDAYLAVNQSRIEQGQLLTESLVAEEENRLNAIAEKEQEYHQKRLEQGEINELEYNELINGINQENQIAKDELELSLSEQKKAAEIQDIENRRVANQEAFEVDFAAQREQLSIQRTAELAAAEKTGADKALIERKFAALEIQLANTVQENKLAIASDTFENLATILGKETAAGKAAAIAQTTISTYQSATSAFNSLSGIPIVGPALGAIAAAAAVAAGLANVRKIVSTQEPQIPKAEQGMQIGDGGLLKGARHSNGGIPIEAEGGEWVINRKSSAMFSPLLSAINEAGTGSSGVNYSGFFADGGQVSRSIVRGGGVGLEEVQELISGSIGNLKVINVATDTEAAILENAIIVENASA